MRIAGARRLALVALAVTLATTLAAAGAEIPRILAVKHSDLTVPDWVAAEVAAPDGQLRPEWLPELGVENLRRRLRLARSDHSRHMASPAPATARASAGAPSCDASGRRIADYYVFRPTLEQVLDHSGAAILGRMEESRTGFYRGEPAVLWRVPVDRVLKWPEDPPPAEVYVLYGKARVEIDGLQVCMTINGSAPVIAGREVFVASYARLGGLGLPIMDDGMPLMIPMVEEILVQQPDGSAVWGRREVPWNDVQAELDRLAADEAGDGVVPDDL